MAYGWAGLPCTRADGLGLADRPGAPTNLNATTVSDTEIDVSWTAPATGTVSGYKVERGTNGVDFVQITTNADTTYSDTGLTEDTLYYYRVKAYNAAEDGPSYSGTDSATTSAEGGGGEMLGSYTKPSAATTGLSIDGYDSGDTVDVLTDYAAETNDAVIELKRFVEDVWLVATGVTFRNCIFVRGIWSSSNGSEYDPTKINTGCLIDKCEFIGEDTGYMCRGVDLKRSYMHGMRQFDFCNNATDCTWESNYFEDWLAFNTDAHMDALQYVWGTWGAPVVVDLNVIFRGNYWNLDMGYELQDQQNAVLWISSDSHTHLLTDCTIEYNWFKSGGYPIRIDAKNDASIQINNNRWEESGFNPILIGTRAGQGYTNIGWTGNEVKIDGVYEPLELPPGENSNLIDLDPG